MHTQRILVSEWMLKHRCCLYLWVHRYVEVVGLPSDGQPRMQIFDNCGQGLTWTRLDLDQRPGIALFQLMENNKKMYYMGDRPYYLAGRLTAEWAPTRFTGEKSSSCLEPWWAENKDMQMIIIPAGPWWPTRPWSTTGHFISLQLSRVDLFRGSH